VNGLLRCPLQVAFSRDERFASLRRPSVSSALGSVAHALSEMVGKGAADAVSDDQLLTWLDAAWNDLIEQQHGRLSAAWRPATVPAPRDWPGFMHLKVATTRRLRSEIRATRDGRIPTQTAKMAERAASGRAPAQLEVTLVEESSGLYGTPDRVEEVDGRLRVVDLKTGGSQGEATEAQRRQLLLYAALVAASRGRLPDEITVMDASGRCHPQPVDLESVQAATAEATGAVDAFNAWASAPSEDVSAIARPSPDSCRWCGYRVVCQPYWTAQSEPWLGHTGAVGKITEVQARPSGSMLRIAGSMPSHLDGLDVTVSELPSVVAVQQGSQLAVVDTDLLGAPQVQRARWNTTWRVAAVPD
jgi:RecB family exonuclease